MAAHERVVIGPLICPTSPDIGRRYRPADALDAGLTPPPSSGTDPEEDLEPYYVSVPSLLRRRGRVLS